MNLVAREKLLAAVAAMPALPAVVSELLNDLQSASVDVDTLAAKIALDSALTARLLQLANSSFYGLPRQVDSVTDAVHMLGLRNVRSVVTAASVMGEFPQEADSAISFQSYWQHAVVAAQCAQKIATLRDMDPGNAYIAALLHDIGSLVLATRFTAQYRHTCEHHLRMGVSMVQAERTEMGLDHAMVGAALAAHWRFPDTIRLALADHHEAESSNPLVMVVQLANEIAHAQIRVQGDEDRLKALPADAWQRLRLSEDDVLAVFTQADEAVTLVENILH